MTHPLAAPHPPWLRGPAALFAATLALGALGACGNDGGGDASDADGAAAAQEERSGSDPDADADPAEELYPDVVDVEVRSIDDRRYEVSTTLSSPYDSPERYADAWRVLGPAGEELGVRELAHAHGDEQPFTRSTEVEIPDDISEVTVEGRDQVSGWGGETMTVSVPR